MVRRYALSTSAPSGYTIDLDIAQLQAAPEDIRVFVDDVTEIDRLIENGHLFFKMPAEGALSIHIDERGAPPRADPSRVFMFAESFDDASAMPRFDLQPPGDWSVTTEHVLHVAGASRHPGQINGLALGDGEVRARIRFGAAMGQQHNGVAARGKSMAPLTMDGFVGQLQADVQQARIAEYSDGFSPPAELVTMNRAVDRGVWYALRLRYVGDSIELFIDGVQTLVATKSGSDGELVGIFAHDCEVDFDDVRVRLAMDPEPVATIGPEEQYCD